ncbi:MAG: toxin-antitoxin system YwqK family antitoxin [Bacteroidetes bacterium]|nr:toxin-antitoxin system YwqK family antitoxin [Bacteroidota bacterium]
MKHLLTIIISIPFLSFGQTKNYKDERGWRQGIHDGFSGSSLFERSYKNDTLNGYFREYNKEGITWTTGYFKNGKHDSLWLEFYPNGTIKSRKFYKDGLMNGELISYFENGQTSYRGTFKNDTIEGETISFYLSGAPRAKGNRTNGEWIEYYDNGNIKLKQTFVNAKLLGETKGYSENGNILLPRFIAQSIVVNDTSILNNSDLKLYLLLDTRNSKKDLLKLGEYLFYGIQVCDNGNLTIHVGLFHFVIYPTGLEVHETSDTICKKKIIAHEFSTNRNVKKLKNGEYDISYVLEKKYFTTQVGKVEIERKQMSCDDTGYNPIRITNNNKSIYFKDIGNIIFFEYDSDKDGEKELYILNYFSCTGHLEIYKIE